LTDGDLRRAFIKEMYLSMKRQMEMVINQYQLAVINTTVGGIDISGASFQRLAQLLE